MDNLSKITERRTKDLKEIGIVIDSWDDVFSDFDPRPLTERTVSEDFVDELRKRYKETRSGEFIITIYAPFSLKDEASEKMVTQRLKKHFRHKLLQKKKLIVRIRLRGVIFVLIGVCSLSFLTLATYYKFVTEITIQIMGIFLMPLGWFGFWEGLSKLVDTSPVVIQDEKLFEKISKARYSFKYITEHEE
ncbi:MAG: hypothetical protein ABIH45_04030 [Candidatus Omnitrophota bacterium]